VNSYDCTILTKPVENPTLIMKDGKIYKSFLPGFRQEARVTHDNEGGG